MFSRFTEKAIQLIVTAQDLARDFASEALGTEHLLLALLDSAEKGGIILKVLENIRIERGDLIDELEEIISGKSITAVPENIPFTPQVKKVLGFAWEEARQLGHSSVSVEHLFLALLREADSVAARILNNHNVSLLTVKNAVLALLGAEVKSSAAEYKLPADTPLLNEFARDLTWLAMQNKLDPVVGREREIERIVQILSRRTKNNPVLTGDAGVGKTAIVEGLAQRILKEEVPKNLRGKRVVTLDLGLLVAGTKYRGEFEDRMKKLLAEVKKASNVIMFVDELHTIVGTGSTEGSLDVANMFKPAMARGEIQVIGATTLNEYRKFIEDDAALERRFQSILVDPPTDEETLKILRGIIGRYEEFHEVKFLPEALEAAVQLSIRYITDRQLPDKAVDLIDEAAARVILKGKKKSVSAEDIAEIVALWKGIPVAQASKTEAERLLSMGEELQARIVGQDEAVAALVKAIKRAKAGLKDPKRPLGSFIFLGASGMGKTELAKALAEFMFGDQNNMIRIDMSEYTEKHTVSRLVGSPPGYIGHDEGGQLTEPVRRRPYSVVLFDEIEKAAPEVHNILLQIMDDGILTDANGRKVDFKNTVIIMTSNAGTQLLKKDNTFGFVTNADRGQKSYEKIKETILGELKNIFSPEFLNRLDDTIIFRMLDKTDMQKIIRIMLADLNKRLSVRGMTLTISDAAAGFLVDKGFVENQGARPLRRIIQDQIENQLADKLLSGEIAEHSSVQIDLKNQTLTFSASAGARPAKKRRAAKKLVKV
ncbi:MAG: ATP-dependent Clp protease ATP-binding subunit [Candidatus Margulisbacteria bacterium]|jgi:ATP-dependent Clp protease ATP-binding subunit ClpC|nr:ATP-dependent Clp protease ATP-binding subunit [Candidatus Margulisiibacteriota bacterium]